MTGVELLNSEVLLTADEVARVLKVEVGSVEYLARMKDLPGVRIGKHRRWRPETVRRFVESLEEAS